MITATELPAGVADFSDNSTVFKYGKAYIGDGGYSKAEADAEFANLTTKATALSKFTEISDLADKPYKLESKLEKLRTANYVLEGKRSNTIEITLIGLSAERKRWLEEDLGKKSRTILLENTNGDSVLIFNEKRWVCEWTYEAGNLFNAVISTEYTGPTTTGFMVYLDIPAE